MDFQGEDPICRDCKRELRAVARAAALEAAEREKAQNILGQVHLARAAETVLTKKAIDEIGIALKKLAHRGGFVTCTCCGSVRELQVDEAGNAWCVICRHYIEAVGQCVFHFGPVVYPERTGNPMPAPLPDEILLPPLPPAPELPAVLPPEEA